MKIIPSLNKQEKELYNLLDRLIDSERRYNANCNCANCRIDEFSLDYLINNYNYNWIKDTIINRFNFIMNVEECEESIIIHKDNKEIYLWKKLFENENK